ncbi:MAG: PilN domain-containing protein [Candidatus Omnitrophica bacterium]|nr:PilN domain-containing protein [Candidatus Omnitrophota bacterium]
MTMIDINLMPENLRKRRKGKLLPGGFKIPLEVVIGIVGALLMLIVLAHIYLLAVNLSQLGKQKILESKKKGLAPAKENVDAVIAEMRVFQDKKKAMESINGENEILWSQKLNLLSNNIPRGVWLKKVAFNGEVLFIDGSAISRQNEEMLNAQSLVTNLKKDGEFLKQLKDLEVGSIQRRVTGAGGIADFLITVKLK